MDNITIIGEDTLQHVSHLLNTPSLSSPLELSFIISLFIVWLILGVFTHWLPSLLEKRFSWISWHFFFKDLLFIFLFALVYILIYSRWLGWLTSDTYGEFCYGMVIFLLASATGFLVKYWYLSNSFKWMLKSYLLLSVLILWFNIILDVVAFYFDLF